MANSTWNGNSPSKIGNIRRSFMIAATSRRANGTLFASTHCRPAEADLERIGRQPGAATRADPNPAPRRAALTGPAHPSTLTAKPATFLKPLPALKRVPREPLARADKAAHDGPRLDLQQRIRERHPRLQARRQCQRLLAHPRDPPAP